jgi:hypothetical protein
VQPPLPLDTPLLLVKPPVGLSTPQIFKSLDLNRRSTADPLQLLEDMTAKVTLWFWFGGLGWVCTGFTSLGGVQVVMR